MGCLYLLGVVKSLTSGTFLKKNFSIEIKIPELPAKVFGKCLIIIFIMNTSVSSGCEKKVKIWNIETQRCLHVLDFSDNFSNVTFPKISLDKRFLLVSTPNHIELWNGRIVFLVCYLMKLDVSIGENLISCQPQKLRKMPVQDLVISLHIENRGIAYSCYKAAQIWDFHKIDSSESLFCGTMTKF